VPETVGSETQASEVFGIRGYQANVYIAPIGAGTVTVTTTAATFTVSQSLVAGDQFTAAGQTFTIASGSGTSYVTTAPASPNVTAGTTFQTYNSFGMLTPSDASQWLRVQNADYNIDFRMEALRQVAYNRQGTTVYHRAVTFPLNMTVNATVTETDWADWKALLDKTFPGGSAENDLWENMYDFSPGYLKKEFAVVIRYYTKDGTLIQQLDFPDLRIDGFGSRVNVGGRSEVTWTFRGTAVKIKGYDIA
jgi:hypothetical protein